MAIPGRLLSSQLLIVSVDFALRMTTDIGGFLPYCLKSTFFWPPIVGITLSLCQLKTVFVYTNMGCACAYFIVKIVYNLIHPTSRSWPVSFIDIYCNIHHGAAMEQYMFYQHKKSNFFPGGQECINGPTSYSVFLHQKLSWNPETVQPSLCWSTGSR